MNKNILKLGLVTAGLVLSQVAFGQSLDEINAANASYADFNISLATVLYIFAIILVLIAAGMMLIAVNLKKYLKGEIGEEYESRQPFWERVFQVKAVSSDKDTLINHPHDGIYELDNPPPPWFMFLFYGTIAFAVIYFVRFTWLDSGYTQAEEYAEEMQMAEEAHKQYLSSAGDVIDENSVTLLTTEADLTKGKAIYEANCVTCHGSHGQGGVGPNFTDKNWIYGGDVKDVFYSVKYGRPKGMQPWAASIGAGGMQAVASYVISLEGTTLPDGIEGKEPQGEIYERGAATTDEAAEPAEATESEEATAEEGDTEETTEETAAQ